MKSVILGTLVALCMVLAWQASALSQSGTAPQNGVAGQGSYSRRLQAGDIVIIPPGVLHVWTEIPDQVTYLSVRPDPDRVLPGGYVNPLLLKNQPAPVK